ncbi:MAG: aminoacyl-tRNA hydrolase [Pseudomonadota bacterium]
MAGIQLIVGLGNPGPQYEATRHNVGFWFVDALARAAGTSLKLDTKHHGQLGKTRLSGTECWLLKPTTFMNRSGQSVGSLANFYKIPAEEILVVHDELDIPAGHLRLKRGGGHGGHNGLRDIITALGSKEFVRLRLGIGHPGHASEVSNYVLSKPSPDDRSAIERAIDEAQRQLLLIMQGELEKAMNHLHSYKP